jgi:4-oxalocrotonate tautomerase
VFILNFAVLQKIGGIKMPILRVSLWSGRTKEEKADLAKALTDTMVKVAKVPSDAVTIMFEELPKDCWSTGGVLHCEKYKTDNRTKTLI